MFSFWLIDDLNDRRAQNLVAQFIAFGEDFGNRIFRLALFFGVHHGGVLFRVKGVAFFTEAVYAEACGEFLELS